MEAEKWLRDLGTGDEVAVYNKINGKMVIGRIAYRSAQSIVVESEGRGLTFSGTGQSGYGTASHRRLVELTPEMRAELERPSLMKEIQKMDLSHLPTETLKQILALAKNGA